MMLHDNPKVYSIVQCGAFIVAAFVVHSLKIEGVNISFVL